jgi:hypothetical protein
MSARGLLDHDLDTAVLCPALQRFVRSHRVSVARPLARCGIAFRIITSGTRCGIREPARYIWWLRQAGPQVSLVNPEPVVRQG